MATVLFDLDGTITRKDSYLPFLFYCSRTLGLRMGPALLLPIVLFLYCFRVVSNRTLKEVFLKSVLSGVHVDQLKPIVERYVAALMQDGLNPDSVSALEHHLKKGDRVMLVTASFDLYVEALADRFGIAHVVCTRAEISNGVVTGRILGKNCHGTEKVRRLENLLKTDDWKDSLLYTDHHSDFPLLTRVSRAYLVNPSLMTLALLKRRKLSAYSLK